MWTREMLKTRAKAAFNRNYWKCVLISLVLMVIGGGGSGISYVFNNTGNSGNKNIYDSLDSFGHYGNYSDFGIGMGIFLGIFALIAMVFSLIAILLDIFAFQPMQVGGCRFFMENAYEPASPYKIFFSFRSTTYWKTVGTMFLKNLFTALWSLLFVIPGIYKAYEYRMIPYLLADCPDLSREDAFRISKEMMDGHKMNAFILDLSFIGWTILSGLTFGILYIFYVGPYIQATNAELFLELKQEYFAKRGQSF